MKISKELAVKTHKTGKSFGALFNKLMDELEKILPPNIRISWIDSELTTLAHPHEKERYGEDLLFVFHAYDEAESWSMCW